VLSVIVLDALKLSDFLEGQCENTFINMYVGKTDGDKYRN